MRRGKERGRGGKNEAMADASKVDNEYENDGGSSSIEEQNRKDGGANGSGAPFVCLARFAGDSAAGAFMGSIFGYGPCFFFFFNQIRLVSSHVGCFCIWVLLRFFQFVVFVTILLFGVFGRRLKGF